MVCFIYSWLNARLFHTIYTTLSFRVKKETTRTTFVLQKACNLESLVLSNLSFVSPSPLDYHSDVGMQMFEETQKTGFATSVHVLYFTQKMNFLQNFVKESFIIGISAYCYFFNLHGTN